MLTHGRERAIAISRSVAATSREAIAISRSVAANSREAIAISRSDVRRRFFAPATIQHNIEHFSKTINFNHLKK
jgi:hypothetical protein